MIRKFAAVLLLLCLSGSVYAVNTTPNPNNVYGSSVNGASGIASGTAGQLAVYNGTNTVGPLTASLYNKTNPLPSRAPANTDDSSQGYAVGNLWNAITLNNPLGQIWAAQSVGVNTASWQLLPNVTLPVCDLVTGAVGCYGVYRMKASYSGAAFQVQCGSSSTPFDVPFDVTGYASWNYVDAVNVISSGVATCRVSKWYDQSGNGYDLTQGTYASMPPIYNSMVGKTRGISFSTGAVSAAQTLLTNSSLPITTRNTFTSLAVISADSSSNQTSGEGLFALNSGSANWFYYTDIASSGGLLRVSPGSGNVSTATMMVVGPQMFMSVNNAGTLTTCQNNVCTPGIATAFSSTASTGLILGGNGVLGYFQGTMTSFVIYNSALSAANQQLIQQAAVRDNDFSPQAKVNLLFHASSLICCAAGTAPPQQMFPLNMQASMNDPVRMTAFGYAGQTCANFSSNGTYGTAVVTAAAYVSGMTNIYIPDGCSNDFAGSTSITAATVLGYLQTACSAAHSSGFKCYIMSLFPRGATANGLFTNGQTAAGFEADRQALLTLEKAANCGSSGSWCDGFIDPADDPVLGPQASSSNATYFLSDQTHLTLWQGMNEEAAIHLRGLAGVVQ